MLGKFDDENAPRILVYQMGKVGSVAIQVSLRQKGFHTLHAHYMWLGKHGEYDTSKPDLIEEIFKKDHRWPVISLVREPISRNISAFFQRIEQYYKPYKNYKYSKDLVTAYLNNYPHFWPLVWFDIEFAPVFQIDVYSEKFDHDKGYHIYHGEYADLLVLRTENINDSLTQAIEEFTGIRGIKPALSNYTTNRRGIAQIYTDFKESADFPKQYTDWMYNSRYAKHFYSDEEREVFKDWWTV